ncbi:MAG: iron ABC transporter permease [Rhodobacteraceae bacterium]|nr:iron ABC transporter permease [Paracoccaceae bacterium]
MPRLSWFSARAVVRLRGVSPWSALAVLIAAIVLAPVAAVIGIALNPADNIWPHLLATILPRYLLNTLVLMVSVATLSTAMGAGAGWLVSRYCFPLRRWLEWALLMPLAIPAYVGAYALVDFLEYAGPLQSGLRSIFGWQSARAYWFPEIRSLGAAVIVFSAALYPYVYLLARAAFANQPGEAEEVARSLGCGALARFWRVGLPLARPALAAGAAVVMMETVSDFGTVDYFAVQTLTTGIFSIWLESNNAGGAAQIALVLLGVMVLLVILEKSARRQRVFFSLSQSRRPPPRTALRGLWAVLATSACLLPLLVGFVLPVAVIASHAWQNMHGLGDPLWLVALLNTLSVGGCAAVITVAAGLLLVYGVRLSGRSLPPMLMSLTTIGYAIPGAVLAVGILLPLVVLDHALADLIEALTQSNTGLLLTGSAFALILAYCVRFFAIAQGAAEAALNRIPPNLGRAARSMGQGQGQVLLRVYLPLARGSIGAALLLVFVDCVKELPATMLLRPFNYETLATRVHDQASLENLGDASPGALMIVAVGLVAVGLLARAMKHHR